MLKLDEIRAISEKINNEIHELLKVSGYENYQELECEYEKNAETMYVYDNLQAYLYNLDRLTGYIDRLSQRITDTGHLQRNENGRYELNGREFTCGSSIEFLCTDDYHDMPYWRYSSIEARNGEYYLTASPETPLDGLEVRLKRG